VRVARPIIVALGALTISSHVPAAWACSCLERPQPEQVAVSDVVVTGVVVDARPRLWRHDGEWVIDVEEVWKGAPPDPVAVRTNKYGASCGWHFVIGSRYKIYASARGDTLYTSLCSGNDLVATGPGLSPARPSLWRTPFAIGTLVTAGVVGPFLVPWLIRRRPQPSSATFNSPPA
jgi:hypothetical protein